MREQLLALLSQFNRGEISVQHFRDGLEELNKRGIFQSLTPKERDAFHAFFTWYASVYDRTRSPRTGLVGKVRNALGEFWGEYRVSLDELKQKAVEVERSLTGADG